MIHFFRTEAGILVPAITTRQMREVDRLAIEETGPNLYQMMENAGRNLAIMAIDMIGDKWRSQEIIVLAGVGGNGGGGICAARHLINRGANVRVCVSNVNKLTPVPLYQRQIYLAAGGLELELADLHKHAPILIVDAMIGYSLQGPPRGNVLEMIHWANSCSAKTLSLDAPSGVDSTTGSLPGEKITPEQTMTLALPKTGLLPKLTGDLWLADIGIPKSVYERIDVPYISPFEETYFVKLAPQE
ncbi:MAG: NAD(P)H-hydrate epimerase [Calditrichia bacterium]